MNTFDPIRTTATELQQLLRLGSISSADIVDTYLAQIEKHNYKGLKLNGLISVAPRELLLLIATALDQERKEGQIRSNLHGIPIVIKDSIVTDARLGMPTNNGSPALKDAKATRSARVIDRLIEAGIIILGKANLTEASGMKSPDMMPGWSPSGGQTESPYTAVSNDPDDPILGNSRPGGSSSGSAVSVAAGFAPLALGTDAVGSVVTPGNQAALYALKLPPGGEVPGDGIFGISDTFDGVGGMTKSSADLASLTAVLLGRPLKENYVLGNESLSVGFVDPKEWKLPDGLCKYADGDEEQMIAEFEEAASRVEKAGIRVTAGVDVPSTDILKPGDNDPYRQVAYYQCRHIYKAVFSMFENNQIHSIEDMIKWNEENAEIALPKDCPNQKDLTETIKVTPDPIASAALHNQLRRLGGQEGLDPVSRKHKIDIIVAPADCGIMSFAAAAGYPSGLVPMSVVKSHGRPFGMQMIAKAGGEEKMLRFMREWEGLYPIRPLPKPLMD